MILGGVPGAEKPFIGEMWVRVTRVAFLLLWANHVSAGGLDVSAGFQLHAAGIQNGELAKYFGTFFMHFSWLQALNKVSAMPRPG